MSVVEELRHNDPAATKTKITILLRHETSDADLAEALERNLFVTEIHLDLKGVQTTDWAALLRVILTRENLGKMTLREGFDAKERNAPPTLVRAFLRSIQQNNSIRSVVLECIRLPADVSTFVDTASAITSFSFSCKCDFAPTERERGTRDLASALQRNTNITHLTLCISDDSFAIPILQALQSNDSLKNLVAARGRCSDATSHAMHQLLESSTSIMQFHLEQVFIRGETLRPIAQGLIQSQSVCELNFSLCLFRETAAVFRSILQEKRNLVSLRLDHCVFQFFQVLDAIISSLSQQDSPLRNLVIEDSMLGNTFPNIQFENLLRSVEKSRLERFTIGQILSHHQLQTLTQHIPSLRIKELEVQFATYFDRETAKEGILQALQSNFSLRSVTGIFVGGWPETDLFDNDHDKKRLEFYANRNERLDQWVDNPVTVNQKVWPEALTLAENAGPGFLFRGLRSVLGSDSSLQVARKHKDPE